MPLILVSGPARSGKSEFAEQLAQDSGLPVTYVATAALDTDDQDWAERIQQHRARRPTDWATLEAPNLLDALQDALGDKLQNAFRIGASTTSIPKAITLPRGSRQPDDQQGKQPTPAHCLLIDSLGTWVANRLETNDSEWRAEVEAVLEHLARLPALCILVAEETGWGVVPAYPLGRQFRDRLGHLVRQIAPLCETSYLVAAGHILDLGQLGRPLSP